MAGDLIGAVAALDEALALDPMNLMARVAKGFLLERLGRPREADDLAPRRFDEALAMMAGKQQPVVQSR